MLQLASQGWFVCGYFRVGAWLVRPNLNTISKNGTDVQVEPKVMEVLVCLATRPGESISKETIIKAVWPDTFVSDDALIRCVSELRRVFGDEARAPSVIQTIPKRGYRLVAPVEYTTDSTVLSASPPVESAPSGLVWGTASSPLSSQGHVAAGKISSAEFPQVARSESPADVVTPSVITPEKRNKRAIWIFGLTSLCVIAGAIALWRWWASSKVAPRHATIVSKQLTANAPGDPVRWVALSRDGRHLAYTNYASDKMHILDIDSLELRDLPAPDNSIPWDWFPDGSHLLIGQIGKRGIWKMSVWDGSYQQIFDGETYVPTLSPDGSYVAFFNKNMDSLSLVGTDGTGPHRIVSLNSGNFGFSAWSPRSRLLLFARSRPNRGYVIEACDLQGGHRRTIMSDLRPGFPDGKPTLYWLPDGRIVYYISDRFRHNFEMWSLKADPDTATQLGQPTWLATGDSDDPLEIRADGDGHRLIYLSNSWNTAVYVVDLRSSKTSKAQRLTTDNWDNSPEGWSRDSAAILYTSIKGNKSTIYSQSLDRQPPKALISGDELYYDALLTPDGDHLLFSVLDSSNPSVRRLMSVPVQGGIRSVLLASDHSVSDFSYACPHIQGERCVLGELQGKQLIFSVLDTINGKGAEIQRVDVDPASVHDWSLSPDGTRIAIDDSSTGWIRILTIADPNVVSLPRKGNWQSVASVTWAADGKHLFATAWSDHFSRQAILSIDLEGNTKIIDELRSGTFGQELTYVNNSLWALKASPDGRYLAYRKTIWDGNVMMLENP